MRLDAYAVLVDSRRGGWTRFSFSLALALLFGLAAPTATAVPRSSPFPLAPGNRWQLRDEQSGATRIVAVQRRGDALVLRGFPGLGPTRVRALGGAVEAYDSANGRWEAFLRLDAPVGTPYTVRLGDEPLWRAVPVRVASRTAIVEDARERVHPTASG